VVADINTVATTTIATLTGKNYLTLTTSGVAAGDTLEIGTGDANAALGLTDSAVGSIDDADDGLSGEGDDVRATTENITGGAGDDLLIGNANKNVIKGGAGSDTIEGGGQSPAANSCALIMAAEADSLQGEAGDDTIYVPAINCHVVVNGGADTDTVTYAGRQLDVALSNGGGTADDGYTAGMERGSIETSVEIMVGGYGDDTITGAAGNDTLRGGPGADTLSGAAGDDTLIGGAGNDILNGGVHGTVGDSVDYTDTSYLGALVLYGLRATLCFDTTAATGNKSGGNMTCGVANDGLTSGAGPGTPFETDQILNVEVVVGTDGADNVSMPALEVTAQEALALASRVGLTLHGGEGDDTLTGGPGNDTLWGDDDADTLTGGAGADSITGGADADVIDGGADDDVCVSDADDTVDAVSCELPG
jgi:Ca2+-binding RTX toxin-like protein